MNTAIKPPPSNFAYIVDDVNKTPDSLTWLNDRVLQFAYSEAALGPAVVNLSFPAPHPLLRFATGEMHGSFLSPGAEFVPTIGFEYSDPALNLEITFPVEMDQTVVPITADFVVEVDGSGTAIDNIEWDDGFTLLLELTAAGETGNPVVVIFATPTPRLRATDTHQACPFTLNIAAI